MKRLHPAAARQQVPGTGGESTPTQSQVEYNDSLNTGGNGGAGGGAQITLINGLIVSVPRKVNIAFFSKPF